MAIPRDLQLLGTIIEAHRAQLDHLRWLRKSDPTPGLGKAIRHSREMLREYKEEMYRYKAQNNQEGFGYYYEGRPGHHSLAMAEQAAYDAQFSHIAAAMYAIDVEDGFDRGEDEV